MTPPHPETRRILLVDDNRESIDVMGEIFDYLGHQTHIAYEGIDAIAAAAWFSPDVVILDLSMPGMHGLAVAQALRSMPNVCDAAIILLTGSCGKVMTDSAREAGVDAILIKPAGIDRIILTVDMAIAKRKISKDQTAPIRPVRLH